MVSLSCAIFTGEPSLPLARAMIVECPRLLKCSSLSFDLRSWRLASISHHGARYDEAKMGGVKGHTMRIRSGSWRRSLLLGSSSLSYSSFPRKPLWGLFALSTTSTTGSRNSKDFVASGSNRLTSSNAMQTNATYGYE